MSLKERISSPLEAGLSILDAYRLPPHLEPALEYTSKRLTRKGIHLSLVIVRQDYQLPVTVPAYPSSARSTATPSTPGSPPPLTGGSTSSSSSGRFPFSSPVVALKQLVRSASQQLPTPTRSNESLRSAASSPGYPPTDIDLQSPKFRWPLSPMMPLSPSPRTPSTPGSMSTTTTDTNGPPTPAGIGHLYCFHGGDLSPRTENILKSSITKAGSRFGLGSHWLTPFSNPAAQDITSQLFTSSIIQNEVLFASDGLTLLSLDHLYSLKSALSSYSKTGCSLRLEDAVDELRRFILANHGCKVARPDLLRSYDWLSVSAEALVDLDNMYKKAYGGVQQVGGISGLSEMVSFKRRMQQKIAAFHPAPKIYNDDDDGDDDDNDNDEILSPSDSILDANIKLAMTAIPIVKPPTPRRIAPPLKVQTDLKLGTSRKTSTTTSQSDELPKVVVAPREEKVDEEEEHTARPLDRSALQAWNNRFTIDQILTAGTPSSTTYRGWGRNRGSQAVGPITPNVYDDISPITRGEWGYMMGENALNSGRTVAVETF